MAPLFSFRECDSCGESHPVLSDGRMSIHFTRDADRCPGSERTVDDQSVSEAQARAVDRHLRHALNELLPGQG